MKAVIFKRNGKVIFAEQIREITTKEFLNLQKEVDKTWQEKDQKVVNLENEISALKSHQQELDNQIVNLQHQINLITGVEEESEVQE